MMNIIRTETDPANKYIVYVDVDGEIKMLKFQTLVDDSEVFAFLEVLLRPSQVIEE